MTEAATKYQVLQKVLQKIGQNPFAALIGPQRVLRWSGLQALWKVYRDIPEDGSDFAASMLSNLDITINMATGSVGDIPDCGPLIIVANHPTGGAEGLVALSILCKRRNDLQLLGNRLLSYIPEIAYRQFSVGTDNDARRSMLAAARHLRNGGAVLVFPAGTVAHWQLGRGYAEAPWHPSIARLASITGAAVLPLYFSAKTSLRWRILSAVSKLARTALLPLELLAQQGRTIDVDVGKKLVSADEIAQYFRDRA